MTGAYRTFRSNSVTVSLAPSQSPTSVPAAAYPVRPSGCALAANGKSVRFVEQGGARRRQTNVPTRAPIGRGDPSPDAFPAINPVGTVPMLERCGLAATRGIEYSSWLSRENLGRRISCRARSRDPRSFWRSLPATPRRSIPGGDLRMGRGSRLQGRADPDLGRPAVRSARRRRVEDLLRRGQGHLPRARRRRSPSCRPICRASSSRSIRP